MKQLYIFLLSFFVINLAYSSHTISCPNPPPVAEFEVQHHDCVSLGTVTVNYPLGSQYEYSISGITYPGGAPYQTSYQSNPIFNNLPWGDYQVTVKEGDCTSTTSNITISRFYPSASTHYADCYNETGSITVYAPFIAPQFEYSIDGTNYIGIEAGSNYYVFEDLIAGQTYTVYLRDVFNNCVVTRTTTIPQILQEIDTPTLVVSQPNCLNLLGSITITSPISWNVNQYSIDGGQNYQFSPVFENLEAGTYEVMVKRGVQCFSEIVEVVLNLVDSMEVPSAVVTQPTCENPSGSITFTNPIGDAFEYSINGTNYYPYHIFENLSDGTYYVTVRNGSCISEPLEIVISNENSPQTPITVVTNNCGAFPDANAGTITITSPLGNQYEYSIDGVNYQSNPVFENLPAGTYLVSVKEENCISEVTEVIITSDLPDIPIPIATVIQPDCSDIPENWGQIIITHPLGNEYEYSIDGINYQENPSFVNISTGTYQVTTKYINSNCVSEPLEVTINFVEVPTPEASVIPIICSTVPEDKGVLVITYPLGDNYEYSIDGVNYQSSPLFQILNHNFPLTITVRLGEECISESLVITDVNEDSSVPSADVLQPDCNEPPESGQTGTITVTFPLGDIFQYSIDGINYQNSPEFINVFPGTYQLTFRLYEYCVSDPLEVIIEIFGKPETPIIDVVQPTCENPYGSISIMSPIDEGHEFIPNFEYSVNGVDYYEFTIFNNLSVGTYYVTVRHLVSGCISEVVTVIIDNEISEIPIPEVTVTHSECSDVPEQGGTITVTYPLGNEYQYSIDGINYYTNTVFSMLSSGTYLVTVKLGEYCFSEALEVVVNLISDITPEVNITQPDCNEPYGTIMITNHQVHTYQFSINGEDYQISPIFENLLSGVYQVTIKAGDCVSDPLEVIINELPDISVNLTTVCENENRFLLKAETQENYQFLWNTGENTPVIEIDRTGVYSVIVSLDNCSEEFFIDVDTIPCMIPKGISPNGDFLNDEFDLSGFGNISKVTIFNRYGTNVYSQSNYSNQWKGQAKNGNELPTGTYFYQIEFGNGTQKTGWVYLNREI